MKLFNDFLPIIAFFAVYQVVGGPTGVYAATAAAIGVALVVTLAMWLRHRRVERQQLIMLGVLLLLGGLTFAFHDPRFIKWKPTVVSWLMAGAFLVSQFVGRKPLIERMLGSNIAAPAHVWRRLNLGWALFMTMLGTLNLIVAYGFSTDVWVNFKLFGTLGLSLLFAALQAVYLMRYDAAATETGDR